MRLLLGSLALVGLPIATSLSVWAAIESDAAPWCEELNGSLLRTNAADYDVNVAVSEAMRRLLSGSDQPTEQQFHAAEYRENADAWFTSPDLFGSTQERASRLVRQQRDADGAWLKIEVLSGADMPTLIFVEHEKASYQIEACRLVRESLAGLGVPIR